MSPLFQRDQEFKCFLFHVPVFCSAIFCLGVRFIRGHWTFVFPFSRFVPNYCENKILSLPLILEKRAMATCFLSLHPIIVKMKFLIFS